MADARREKPTPGPWRISPDRKKSYAFIDGPNWYRLAKVVDHVNGERNGVGEANARLIAASPELLSALQLCAEALAAIADGSQIEADVTHARAAAIQAIFSVYGLPNG